MCVQPQHATWMRSQWSAQQLTPIGFRTDRHPDCPYKFALARLAMHLRAARTARKFRDRSRVIQDAGGKGGSRGSLHRFRDIDSPIIHPWRSRWWIAGGVGRSVEWRKRFARVFRVDRCNTCVFEWCPVSFVHHFYFVLTNRSRESRENVG